MTPAHDREDGRRRIAALAEAFGDQLAFHKSSAFDETTTRQRFIDPFFAALGWDVADVGRRGPVADVILEFPIHRPQIPGQLVLDDDEAEDIRVASAVESGQPLTVMRFSRPDYLFRVDGSPKFFVEAKRPSVDISTPGPVFQVKSYAWSARHPLALLTDFEELRVFDCRVRPALDQPRGGLLPEFSLGFSDYEANWDLLWETFSRESVAGGSLERYAAELPSRRGQLPVDQVFLGDLARWRASLARDIAVRNPSVDVWDLNEATQLTLDRLVFIRVCEDRRLESAELLRPVLDAHDPYSAFISVVRRLDKNYNGGLLDSSPADDLVVGADTFRKVVQGLYTPWSPYRFDALGVEILGSIYERALGSRVTFGPDGSVQIEVKPEVRKSGGVYYTPQWVVEEIVRLAIDPVLQGRRPRDLAKFRVLDPACGSGSFLLAVFARLIAHYEAYYNKHPTVDRRLHYEDGQGLRRLTADGRAGVLRRHIFGVDVDPAAVEVTMMSLYLKSLESESPARLRADMALSGAVLPSLAKNIRVGNSLVSTDFYAQQRLRLDDDEEHRLRPFKWESRTEGFGEELSDGGFDVVLGNPPYFSIEKVYGARHPVPAYLRSAYGDVWQDKSDIYYYFLARAARLAKRRLGFIVSRAFLDADKARRTRAFLARSAQLVELIDFDGFRVFPDAGIATAVCIFDTSRPHGEGEVAVRRMNAEIPTVEEVIVGLSTAGPPFEAFHRKARLDGAPWRFPNPYQDELFRRIDAAGDPLKSLCTLGQGMQTGANGVFAKISDEDAAEHHLPAAYLKRRARNSDIHRFFVADSGENVLYLEDVRRYRDLPIEVKRYLGLAAHKSALTSRAAFIRGDCEWWRFTWPLHQALYSAPRLILPYRTGHLRCAYDPGHEHATLTDTTIVFSPIGQEDLRFIQAVLNSRLMTFRFRGLAKLTSPKMWEAFHVSIADLPIRRIDFDSESDRTAHTKLVDLAVEIEEARRQAHELTSGSGRSLARRRAEGLLDQLDEQVLDLYGIVSHAERSNIKALGAPF